MKTGDKVECISRPESYGKKLTIGKVYAVDLYDASDKTIRIITDDNDLVWYYAKNFKVVPIDEIMIGNSKEG